MLDSVSQKSLGGRGEEIPLTIPWHNLLFLHARSRTGLGEMLAEAQAHVPINRAEGAGVEAHRKYLSHFTGASEKEGNSRSRLPRKATAVLS